RGSCASHQTGGGGGTANVCGSSSNPDRTEGGTASGTGTAWNATTEDVTKLYDNLMTSSSFSKWCVASAPSTTTPISASYKFSGTDRKSVVKGKSVTVNDGATRDTKDWTFQGCQGACTGGSETGGTTHHTRTGRCVGV